MLTNLKTIFFPTDFSKNANQALPFAAELAVRTDATLILLYSSEETYDFAPMVADKKGKIIEKVTRLFEEIAADLKSQKRYKSLKIDSKLLSGHPVVNILEEAKQSTKDSLIVMGTKGATASRKLLFGSFTTEIILRSHIPVLAIPEGSTFNDFKEIMFTTDFHEGDLNTLSEIVALGELFTSNIKVVHVAEEKTLATEIKYRGFRELVEEQFPKARISFEMLMEDDFFVGVADYLAQQPTNLLVMTRYSKNFWEKMLSRNHSKEMGFYTTVPLLTLVGESASSFELTEEKEADKEVRPKQPAH